MLLDFVVTVRFGRRYVEKPVSACGFAEAAQKVLADAGLAVTKLVRVEIVIYFVVTGRTSVIDDSLSFDDACIKVRERNDSARDGAAYRSQGRRFTAESYNRNFAAVYGELN